MAFSVVVLTPHACFTAERCGSRQQERNRSVKNQERHAATSRKAVFTAFLVLAFWRAAAS